MTRHLFEASGHQGHFFEKTNKNLFLDNDLGECVYQISGLYSFSFDQELPYKLTDPQTTWPTYLQVKIGISSTGCSPHMDFDLNVDLIKSGTGVRNEVSSLETSIFFCRTVVETILNDPRRVATIIFDTMTLKSPKWH